jgi:hypothetical protein
MLYTAVTADLETHATLQTWHARYPSTSEYARAYSRIIWVYKRMFDGSGHSRNFVKVFESLLVPRCVSMLFQICCGVERQAYTSKELKPLQQQGCGELCAGTCSTERF